MRKLEITVDNFESSWPQDTSSKGGGFIVGAE